MWIRDKIAGVEPSDLKVVRNRLLTIEGHAAEKYFGQIFQLLPTAIDIERRRTFKAYDGINNTLNLAYTLFKWKVHRAIIKAKLEPYLGFLHSEQFGKPSLVCDLMELYRHLIDDFVVEYCRSLKKKDFTMTHEDYSSHRKGQRQYLKKALAKDMMSKLNSFFESTVDIRRIGHGKEQAVETLINEEVLLLAEYLRNEKPRWRPRIASFS